MVPRGGPGVLHGDGLMGTDGEAEVGTLQGSARRGLLRKCKGGS
jgi:hypothetical protein